MLFVAFPLLLLIFVFVFDVSLINMCLGVFCIGFKLFGTLWVSQIWVAIFFPYGKGATGEGPPRRSKAGRGPGSASGVHAAQLRLWLWSED